MVVHHVVYKLRYRIVAYSPRGPKCVWSQITFIDLFGHDIVLLARTVCHPGALSVRPGPQIGFGCSCCLLIYVAINMKKGCTYSVYEKRGVN
jgi:hypothetical protein